MEAAEGRLQPQMPHETSCDGFRNVQISQPHSMYVVCV